MHPKIIIASGTTEEVEKKINEGIALFQAEIMKPLGPQDPHQNRKAVVACTAPVLLLDGKMVLVATLNIK